MHAEVDERPAARTGFVFKPAAGASVAPIIGGLRIINFAEFSFLYEGARQIGVFAESAHESQSEQLARLFGMGAHFFGFRRAHRHRLFAEHMFARIERRDGAGGVRRVPGTYAYGVKFRKLRQHFVAVGIKPVDVIEFAFGGENFFIDIAQCVQFAALVIQICGGVLLRDIAGADDADLKFFHYFVLPSCFCKNFTAAVMSATGSSPHSRSMVR